MSKKTYEVIGIPIGAPFTVLDGHRVGDVFEYDDLDKGIEDLLVGAAALRIVPKREAREVTKERGETQVKSKDEPAQPQVAEAEVAPAEERAPEPEPAPEPAPEPPKRGPGRPRNEDRDKAAEGARKK